MCLIGCLAPFARCSASCVNGAQTSRTPLFQNKMQFTSVDVLNKCPLAPIPNLGQNQPPPGQPQPTEAPQSHQVHDVAYRSSRTKPSVIVTATFIGKLECLVALFRALLHFTHSGWHEMHYKVKVRTNFEKKSLKMKVA